MIVELPLEALIGLSASIGIVTTAIAFVYRRGKAKGIDDSCAQRIEKDICDLQNQMGEHETESDGYKKTLHKRIDGVETEIKQVHLQLAEMKGSQDTFQEFVREKL